MLKRVSQIIQQIPHRIFGEDRYISGLFYDSRRFEPNWAFIALKGQKTDGHNFIRELYLKGCEVFFVQDEKFIEPSWNATFVLLENTRRSMGAIAKNFWGGQNSKIIGITGTKGKTSTAKILSSSLSLLGIRCGVLGSLWWKLTTPEIIDTFYIINNSFFDYFVMEVTSVAVIQSRVDDIEFEIGTFLGLGHDHLDIHGTVENYFLAKFRFLEMVKEFVVIYQDDWGRKAEQMLAGRKRVLSFSDECVKNYKLSLNENSLKAFFELEWRGERVRFQSSFFGRFNWINYLASYIILRELGFSLHEIKDLFEEVRPPAGRMEQVHTRPYAFVDYAHTPESLQSSLDECLRLRESLGKGRIFVLFGCGGDRDREKRPKMGRIAYEVADVIFLTSDNPRSEDPEAIIRDILAGILQNDHGGRPFYGEECDDIEKRIFVETDRARAIAKALELATEDDIVLIAGKGHENYQIIGDKVMPFSDREVVENFFLSRQNEK